MNIVEYIWMDGAQPTQKLRSKARIVSAEKGQPISPETLPEWSFDGSSTYQATGHDSDLLLHPVRVFPDPVRGAGNYLAICEVNNPDGTPHDSNTRAKLRKVLDAGAAKIDPWFGIEQEYALFKGRSPLGWPDNGYPAPQGPFYCGVGSDEVFGRDLIEAHTKACIAAGIMIYGINAEVMPGQWEFQIGYRGFEGESADPLTVCDHLWAARWLLYRLGEDFGVNATLHPKPVKGDWNGSGAHTNFSSRATRDPKTGMAAMEEAIKKLEKNHARHIEHYGASLGERLTGHHETCNINEFRSGVANRGASIRIQRPVAKRGCGYIEDRRPGANMDPYVVCREILKTVCDL